MKGMKNHIYGLDLIRFLAALMVSAYHLGFRAWATPNDSLYGRLGMASDLPSGWEYSWFGWIGVQVFFVLSGFVIAYTAEGATPFEFVKSRVGRLVPAMWIGATLSAIILIYWNQTDNLGWLYAKSLVLFPIGPWLCGVYWTLGVEIAFYGLIFLLLCVDKFNRLQALTISIGLLSMMFWLLIESGIIKDGHPRINQLLLLTHGCYFALGTMFWLMYRRGVNWGRLMVCLLCIVTAFPQIAATNAVEILSSYAHPASVVTPYAIWLGMVFLMGLSIIYSVPLASSLALVAPGIRQLGLATYPLYLVHYHVGGEAMILAHRAGWALDLSLAIGLITAVVVSLLIAVLLEPGLRRGLLNGLGLGALYLRNIAGNNIFLFRATERLK